MPTRRQLIQKIELNSDQSSVTFSGIPQNYTDLKIVMSARSTRTSDVRDEALVRLNGDSGSNYSYRGIAGNASIAVSNSGTGTSWNRIQNPSATSTSNTYSNNYIYIPNYSNSNINKSAVSTSIFEQNNTLGYIQILSMLWSSTSSITSITITPEIGPNWVANSTFYLYGITHVPIIRGGEEYVLDGFKYHKFTSTASLQVVEGGDVEYLVVAGGGGGGGGNGGGCGGGGAGGLRKGKFRLNTGIKSVIVGSGGAGGANQPNGIRGGSGTTSTLDTVSGSGGGGGGAPLSTPTSGGSGGGGDYNQTGASGNSGNYSPVEGYSGGNGAGQASGYPGAGGGGAGAAGSNSSGTTTGASGGAGALWSGIYYAGGGGGGTRTNGAGGPGGIGGGGAGGGGDTQMPSNALVNSGGGGGGGYNTATQYIAGANGGSGIVIIRYPYDGN